ncbi:MAG: hypothetical protein RR540_03400, partial [Oscillospiraceae bacterium]
TTSPAETPAKSISPLGQMLAQTQSPELSQEPEGSVEPVSPVVPNISGGDLPEKPPYVPPMEKYIAPPPTEVITSSKIGLLPIIIGIVLVLVLVVVVLIGFKTCPFLAKTFLSPDKYYAWVEEKYLDNVSSFLGNSYGKGFTLVEKNEKIGAKGNIELKLGEDFSGQLDLPLNEVGLDFTTFSNDKNQKGSLNFTIDGEALTDVDFFYDKDNMYFKIGALSENFLKTPITANTGSETVAPSELKAAHYFQNDPISQKDFEKIISKYTAIYYSELKDFTKENVVVSDIKCIKLSTTITTEQMETISKKILTEAKSDKVLMKLMLDLGIFNDEADYTTSIETSLENVSFENELPIKMSVFVNRSGKIISRLFTQDNSSISYLLNVTKDKITLNIGLAGNDVDNTVKLTLTKGKDGYSGKGTITSTSNGLSKNFFINVENLKVTGKDGCFASGKITFNTADSDGQFVMVMSVEGEKQIVSAKIFATKDDVDADNFLLELLINSELTAFEDFTIPTDALLQEEYLKTADPSALMAELSKNKSFAAILQAFVENSGGLTSPDDDEIVVDTSANDTPDDVQSLDLSSLKTTFNGVPYNLPASAKNFATVTEDLTMKVPAGEKQDFFVESSQVIFTVKNSSTTEKAAADCEVISVNTMDFNKELKSIITFNGVTIKSTFDEMIAKLGEPSSLDEENHIAMYYDETTGISLIFLWDDNNAISSYIYSLAQN